MQISFTDKEGKVECYALPDEYVLYTNPSNNTFKFWYMSYNVTDGKMILLLQKHSTNEHTKIFREDVTPETEADRESFAFLLKYYYNHLNRCRLVQMVKE